MTILAPPTTEPLRGEDTTVVTSPSPPTAFGYTDPPLPFQLGSIVSDVTHHLDLRLMAPLGNGSYAIVYLAQDEKTGKSYALKCLSKMTLTEEQLDVQSNEVGLG
ncbi:hypothetical protein BC936DRAFT_141531 [Jimgerdemannia flammicorona]|uniref:Protein kinase domain-containing protein n=1 Tax=Jimgerdemannia flammicorona TaxID=994334 RepID=A0A433A237_9FUNG|nr:hypothetical protein BC936DRAFT_141531 [Jimgerdemannia flammicorona]